MGRPRKIMEYQTETSKVDLQKDDDSKDESIILSTFQTFISEQNAGVELIEPVQIYESNFADISDWDLFVVEVIENTKRHGRSYALVTYPNPPVNEIKVPDQSNWIIKIEDGERNTYPR